MSAESADVVLLRILTPERAVFDGAAQWVQIPLEDGFLGVWPGHAPLVGTMAAGIVTYMVAGVEIESPVGPGVLLVDGTHCVVLYTNSGVQVSETDLDDLVEKMDAELEDSELPEILEATP